MDYLPHWKTQTDEWLFSAPLVFSHVTYGTSGSRSISPKA